MCCQSFVALVLGLVVPLQVSVSITVISATPCTYTFALPFSLHYTVRYCHKILWFLLGLGAILIAKPSSTYWQFAACAGNRAATSNGANVVCKTFIDMSISIFANVNTSVVVVAHYFCRLLDFYGCCCNIDTLLQMCALASSHPICRLPLAHTHTHIRQGFTPVQQRPIANSVAEAAVVKRSNVVAIRHSPSAIRIVKNCNKNYYCNAVNCSAPLRSTPLWRAAADRWMPLLRCCLLFLLHCNNSLRQAIKCCSCLQLLLCWRCAPSLSWAHFPRIFYTIS